MEADLKIFTLGRFRVENSEELITEGVNKSSKRWQLLQYLITYRQREISREELITALDLHENSDPEGSLSALVYRLRKRLENGYEQLGDFIKTSGSAYTFNLQRDYWLDAEKFEELCTRSQKLVKEGTEGAADKFEQALSLYQGDYLEEVRSEEWVWNARNHYRDLLVTCLNQLDDYLRSRKKFEKLWEFYEQVHEMVKFDEQLLAGAIKAMLDAGRTGLARLKYEEAVSMFKENDLKLPPELEKLGRKLKSRQSKDADDLIKKIKERSMSNSAFVCDMKTFSEFYELEKRRAERDVPPRQIVHLRLTGDLQHSSLETLAEDFIEHLKTQLRKGDLVCRWDDKHFILLLNGVACDEIEQVITRLKDTFSVRRDLPAKLEIESRCHEITP